MESHTKESDQQSEQKDSKETSPQIVSSIGVSSTDTVVPANEQSHSEEPSSRGGTNLDECEERMECEDKELGYVKVEGNQRKIKEVEDFKEMSIQDSSKVDKLSPFENIGVDTVSELEDAFLEECLPSTSTKTQTENISGREVGKVEIRALPIDRASDTTTSSINTSTSLSKISEPLAIPSTSRDSPGLESEQSSPKKPNFGSHVKQSNPRNIPSISKKYPIPFRKSHNVYLRYSPESSDYGGSPDSLEDPFLMEALYSSDNETEDIHTSDCLESILFPQNPIGSVEMKQPTDSGLTEQSLDDKPSEASEPSLDDKPSEASEPSLDDKPSEASEQILDDKPSEATEPDLEVHPSKCEEDN